jgi:uncharacterized membrane protein YozB (DUF420 family)
MPGLFGTNALLQTDLNLLLQIITFLILLIGYGYERKGKFKVHGSLMGTAVLLHALSFLLVMGPSFFVSLEYFTKETYNLGAQTTLLHAVTGAITLIVGIGLVAAWALRPSDTAACSRKKRIMDVTFLLWLASLIFGTVAYLVFYL